eukprot:scaffold958_cov32-Tisochrysis_lutea.AAC.2
MGGCPAAGPLESVYSGSMWAWKCGFAGEPRAAVYTRSHLVTRSRARSHRRSANPIALASSSVKADGPWNARLATTLELAPPARTRTVGSQAQLASLEPTLTKPMARLLSASRPHPGRRPRSSRKPAARSTARWPFQLQGRAFEGAVQPSGVVPRDGEKRLTLGFAHTYGDNRVGCLVVNVVIKEDVVPAAHKADRRRDKVRGGEREGGLEPVVRPMQAVSLRRPTPPVVVKCEPERLARQGCIGRALPVVVVVAHASDATCLQRGDSLRIGHPTRLPRPRVTWVSVCLAAAKQVILALGRIPAAPQHRHSKAAGIGEERVLALTECGHGGDNTLQVGTIGAQDEHATAAT